MRDVITPILLTYNEMPNLRRTLAKLGWAVRILVIDSGSTDETIETLNCYDRVKTIYHPFTTLAAQWNFALSQVQTSWTLSLDADYELSDSLVDEILALDPAEDVVGYAARFIYRIYGRALRGSLYPERTVLFRAAKAQFVMDGHAQRLVINGNTLPLSGRIFHDDRKPLSRWLASQRRYAREEAEHLLACPREKLSQADRLRLMAWPAPIAVFFYVLLVKRCILDGWPGWFYVLQRVVAEILLALELIQHRLNPSSCPPDK